MTYRLSNAEANEDYNHIPGSEHIMRDMHAAREELWRLKGIAYDTNSNWQDAITNLKDELEGQKTKQKRQEEAY